MTKTREEIDAEKAQKPRPDLCPGSALMAIGEVLAYGYGKHGRCTWTQAGIEQAKAETHIASAFRHLAIMGPAYDVRDGDSGLPHLWHALSQLAIAVECRTRGPALSPERLVELRDEVDRVGLSAEATAALWVGLTGAGGRAAVWGDRSGGGPAHDCTACHRSARTRDGELETSDSSPSSLLAYALKETDA